MYKRLSILGSTGSIGTQALDVVRLNGFTVCALTANSRIDVLEEQIRAFHPALAAVVDEEAAKDLRARVADTGTKVLAGMDGVIECARCEGADTVLNAIVGMAGLLPTLAAIEAGKEIALANKETLVAGGKLVMEAARKKGVRILPVDSEHSAIFQCLQGAPAGQKDALKRIILTASGGPFFGRTKEELRGVTVEQALNHPNWSMGAKITVDSASMFNKALEIMEARWLFDMPAEKIQVVVHPQSILHSAVEFEDGAVIGQMGTPDMRLPILYAMSYPERLPTGGAALDLFALGTLTFEKGDPERFPALRLAGECLRAGGAACAVLNGANEAAVAAFLREEIPFGAIARLVEGALEALPGLPATTLEEIFAADQAARRAVDAQLRRMKGAI